MCFSATASFTAAAALGVVGAAAIQKNKNSRTLPIAVIPVIFAVQQFIEGLLWLSLGRAPQYTMPLTFAFLFFAFLFWPAFVPLAVRAVENDRRRRQLLTALAWIGGAVGLTLYLGFFRDPHAASIVNRCVFYKANDITHPKALSWMYLLATLAPGFISSHKNLKLFSALALLGAAIAWTAYTQDFTSVWCFFAALVSVSIYLYPVKAAR